MSNRIHGRKITKTVRFGPKKEHFCPICNSRLELQEVTRIINANSEEAKYYDLSTGVFRRRHMLGNIKYTGEEYYCPECNKYIPRKKIKEYELKSGKGKKAFLKKILPIAIVITLFLIIAVVRYFTSEEFQITFWL